MQNLKQFLKSNCRNAYISEPGFAHLYVRHGQRYINGKLYQNVFDIANVEVRNKGKGTFSKFVEKLRNNYPDMILYVECVLNPRFGGRLLQLDFKQHENNMPDFAPKSYYWIPENYDAI